eukprot:3080846-Pleurochrysis_carterae.AAC.2
MEKLHLKVREVAQRQLLLRQLRAVKSERGELQTRLERLRKRRASFVRWLWLTHSAGHAWARRAWEW